jgi:hypothetical protein
MSAPDLEREHAELIRLAGVALGTEPELRSSACVQALATWSQLLRDDLAAERARLQRLREGLTLIAAHDGDRHDWSQDVPIPKDTPQELAAALLAETAPQGTEAKS